MAGVFDEFDRVFDDRFDRFFCSIRREPARPVRCLVGKDGKMTVRIEVPGCAPENVSVRAEHDGVHVWWGGNHHLVSPMAGWDVRAATATVALGVLTLTVPPVEDPAPREIKVTGS